jgi:hypothetical protein
VRYVINEHWPYYAYEKLGLDDCWMRRKLGLLYFRLANELQPRTIIDRMGFGEYLRAGCRQAQIVDDAESVQLAIVPVKTDCQLLFDRCNDKSVVVIQDIYRAYSYWHRIERDPRTTVTYDLYYCGIVFFDPKRVKQNYVINF